MGLGQISGKPGKGPVDYFWPVLKKFKGEKLEPRQRVRDPGYTGQNLSWPPKDPQVHVHNKGATVELGQVQGGNSILQKRESIHTLN